MESSYFSSFEAVEEEDEEEYQTSRSSKQSWLVKIENVSVNSLPSMNNQIKYTPPLKHGSLDKSIPLNQSKFFPGSRREKRSPKAGSNIRLTRVTNRKDTSPSPSHKLDHEIEENLKQSSFYARSNLAPKKKTVVRRGSNLRELKEIKEIISIK